MSINNPPCSSSSAQLPDHCEESGIGARTPWHSGAGGRDGRGSAHPLTPAALGIELPCPVPRKHALIPKCYCSPTTASSRSALPRSALSSRRDNLLPGWGEAEDVPGCPQGQKGGKKYCFLPRVCVLSQEAPHSPRWARCSPDEDARPLLLLEVHHGFLDLAPRSPCTSRWRFPRCLHRLKHPTPLDLNLN